MSSNKQPSTDELEEYKVTIGDEIFSVRAMDNLSAKYEAADRFRHTHLLGEMPLTSIVEYARAKLVTPFEPTQTTEIVLKLLKGKD